MKRRYMASLLALCMLLCGCSSVLRGDYVSVRPHQEPPGSGSNQNVSAANYAQLYAVLTELLETGVEDAVISVQEYNQETIEEDVQLAVTSVQKNNPIAAYAVEKIAYQLGTSGGQAALAVQVSYLHNRAEIRKIQRVADDAALAEAVYDALRRCEVGLVLEVAQYHAPDLVQVVEDYAIQHPEQVMESPQVTVNLYPESGIRRVVELKFTYQTSRDALKTMQTQVQKLFDSAALYVSGDAEDAQKYSQLYSFLMERYEYKVETSITPAYSLLGHGVGDSRAFAMVYAAMCRQAGLECMMVSGTRQAESWYWNLVRIDGTYYHVDLLRCSQEGGWVLFNEDDMPGYVWDYSAYPQNADAVQEDAVE